MKKMSLTTQNGFSKKLLKTDVLVSIAVIVYNHRPFIEKAINSILMQKVDFQYKIVIGDDGSTDGTTDVLKMLRDRYPDKIELVLSEKNRGVLNNLKQIAERCNGKYVAVIDGDDEWVYDKKLQTQIDFLINNPDYAGCFHDAGINDTTPSSEKHLAHYSTQKFYSQFNLYKETFYPWDVIHRNIIPSSTLVYVNKNIFDEFKKYNTICYSCDWLCELLIIRNSKFRYFNFRWSIYNNHPSGVTKLVSNYRLIKENISVLRTLLKDDYYGSIKKDVCYSIARETAFLLHCEDAKSLDRKKFLFYLVSFLKYKFLAAAFEARYLLKAYRGKS